MLFILSLLPGVLATLFQTYNGDIDGTVCTGVTPTPISLLTIQAPTSNNSGTIGLHQLAFQTVGDGYVYSGSVSINGITGTYSSNCCSCDAISQSVNGGFSECGLTWCGQENQWQYVDFSTTTLGSFGIPQNATTNIVFSSPISIAPNANGDPLFSLSYALIPPSSSATHTLSNSYSPVPSYSPSVSTTMSASESESRTPSPSISSSSSESESESGTPSVFSTASPSSSLSVSISPSISLSASESGTPSVLSTVSSSESSSLSVSSSSTRTNSITASETTSSSMARTGSATQSPPSSGSLSPTKSPSGICYSANAINGQLSVLGNYYYILPGINVSQPYGSGMISMGNFVSCVLSGSTCRCSYTGGSTVAGCSGRRNSYITYSYGLVTGYTFTNESPTCSYNFVGTIGNISPSITASVSRSISESRSLMASSSIMPSVSRSISESRSLMASSSISASPTKSVGPTPSVSASNMATASYSMSIASTPSPSPLPTVCVRRTASGIVDNDGLSIQTSGWTVDKLLQIPAAGSVAWSSGVGWNPATRSVYHITLSFPTSDTTDYCEWRSSTDGTHSPTGFEFYTAPSGTLLYQTPSLTTTMRNVMYSFPLSGTPNISSLYVTIYKSTTWQIYGYTLGCFTCSIVSPSSSVSGSPSITLLTTHSSTSSISRSPFPSLTSSISSGLSSTVSRSESVSISITSSETPSPSPTISHSESMSKSVSASESISPSPTMSRTGSESISPSPTMSHSESVSISITASGILSPTMSHSESMSKSITVSGTPSLTVSHSATISTSVKVSNVGIVVSESSTPLVYCVPYPSSTHTASETPTSTPLVMMTRYPTNGSMTASSSPLFMMIPYPSSSPSAMNSTATVQTSSIPIILGSTAIGALGASGLIGLFQLLKYLKKSQTKNSKQEEEQQLELKIQEAQEQIQEQQLNVVLPVQTDIAYLCVASADLEDIQRILTTFQKGFVIMKVPPI